ncbi:hypothetical protein [Dictyobacter arantiisoli]|uniref:hypothetical protein n=1 Tax=Dictyobacter arantiisoli TaxID=2014874 RepID=UPI001F1B329D|nr:hypothetical protein [Dictyobacter arantiisoli]
MEPSIHSCRSCPLREQCQWNGSATKKPRQVSVLLHPLAVGDGPLLWQDWSRRVHWRTCMQLLRHQHAEIQMMGENSADPATPSIAPAPLSRAERAHARLSWETRLARNARSKVAGQVSIHLFGVPERFATALGLASA